MTKLSILCIFFFLSFVSVNVHSSRKRPCHKKRKNNKQPEKLWLSKYPFAIFKRMYLIVLFFFVDYPKEKKTHERLVCAAARSTAQTREKTTKKTKRRVYIYRATSIILTSLCVSFWKLLWAFMVKFSQLNTVWGAGAQFPDSVHWEKLYNELLLRWLDVQARGSDEMAPESRLACERYDVQCVSLLAFQRYFWGVHSTNLLYAWQGSRRTPLTHTHRAAYTQEQAHFTAADMRGVGFLKHWHFPVTAGLEGMVAADCCCCCCSCRLWFSRAEYRK